MSGLLRHALLVIGVSLVASTASAAIPDSNGVFHGCYNLFAGSVRIIDGTNCSMFEKAVTWQQKGIAGPVGPQGPAGPPAPGIILDFESVVAAIPNEPLQEVRTFTGKPFTATANAKCIVSVSGFVADRDAPPVEMFLTYLHNGATWTILDARAELNGTSVIQQGTVVTGVDIWAGRTYEFGVALRTYEGSLSATALAKMTITWTCRYQ